MYGPNASGRSRQGAPEGKTQKDALRTRRSFTRGTPRGFRQHGLDGSPFIIRELVAHDSSPQFGSLNHGGLVRCNASGRPQLDTYGIEVEISPPTISAETVENDPEPMSGPCSYAGPLVHEGIRACYPGLTGRLLWD